MSSSTPSKGQRKSEAREKARLLREEAERRDKRNRMLLAVAAVVMVLAVVLVVGLVIQSANKSDNAPAAAPQGVSEEGAVVVGQEDAPVTVSVYLDYQCPACKAFEDASGDLLDSLVEEGAVKVEYHPISILDRFSSGTEFSTRSASAAMCVADAAPASFETFNRQMFTNQPPEGESGLSDEEIIAIATLAGAPESVSACIEEERYVDFVQDATESAREAGLPGTPWVLVNGEPFDGVPGPQELSDAIRAQLLEVGGMRPTDSPSATPTTS